MQQLVRTARDAADVCAPHLGECGEEKLVVLHLDAERRLLKLRVEEAQGAVPVRAIMADAVRSDSAGLILAYCRPSGDASPTKTDIAWGRKLARAAGTLGITLHDHLIFAGGDCRSLRAEGLI
jgi:DNA repair protein RadC